MNLINKDTFIIRTVLLGPKVSKIDRLYCNMDVTCMWFLRFLKIYLHELSFCNELHVHVLKCMIHVLYSSH